MHVAIAIVGFRNPDDIGHCLAALSNQSHADFEVVVCENGGPEAFAALEAVAPNVLPGGQTVTLIKAAGNLGYGGGVNLCLAATRGADAWWVLNPDTQPTPEALAALVARLTQGDCEAVGGTVFYPDGGVQSRGGLWRPWFARAESIGFGGDLRDSVDPSQVERRQNYLNGACMLISRRFLEAVGPMREDYFLYCEEVEWCLRGLARGMRLGFAAGALVAHEQGTTTGARQSARRRPRTPVYLGERNKMLLTRDCFPGCLPVAAACAIALLLARYSRAGAWTQIGYGVSGWFDGLAGRRGQPAFTAP